VGVKREQLSAQKSHPSVYIKRKRGKKEGGGDLSFFSQNKVIKHLEGK